MEDSCWFCHTTPYGDTRNIHQQVFNDNSVNTIKLNPRDVRLLTANTCNVPGKGANDYRNFTRINFCPMCGRDLR